MSRLKRWFGYQAGRPIEGGSFTPSAVQPTHIPAQMAPYAITDLKKVAAVQAAIGFVERAFMSADIQPDSARTAFTPELLGLIGRQLIEEGECVLYLDVVEGVRVLRPTFGHNLRGGPNEADWRYEVHLPGPTRTQTIRRVPAASVLHFRIGAEQATPWKGESPLRRSWETVRALRQIEAAMVNEAARPSGDVVQVPGASTEDLKRVKKQLNAPPGGVVVVSTPAGLHSDSANYGRVGPTLPTTLIQYRDRLLGELLSAMGIAPEIVLAHGLGSAGREGYRRWVYAGVEPIGRVVAREAMRKGDWPDFELTFNALEASDLRAKANAFSAFTQQGLSPTEAARLVGVSLDEAAAIRPPAPAAEAGAE